jgi:PKD repeat protein
MESGGSGPAKGYYSGFTIEVDAIQIIGQDGAIVDSDPIDYFGVYYLAGVLDCSGILIQNLGFDGSAFPSCYDQTAVYCENVSSTTLRDLEIWGVRDDCYHGSGIYVTGGGDLTVNVINPDIYGCNVGIYVYDDTVNVTGGSIQGGGLYSSYCSTGIWADYYSDVTVSGTTIYDCTDPGFAAFEPGTSYAPSGWGIFADNYAEVTVSGCCKIRNNFGGIGINEYGWAQANFNNIYDNLYIGAAWMWYTTAPEQPLDGPMLDFENNWWGHATGPEAPDHDGLGDWVSFGIDYSPWLNGPCPNGKPIGMNAAFKGVARSGEPGLKVQFTDLSTAAPGCEIEEWLWNFGDGSTSTEKNPFHIYNREGAFNVTLTVWDSCGFEQTVTMKAYITIKKPTTSTTVEPAKLGVSYLNIDPAQVLPNQEVTISANICNSGEERGTKTVSLMVNGEAVASQSVGVSGGSCQQVVFKTSRAVPGTYQVAIDGMTGEFSVLAPRTVTRDVPSQQQTGLGTAGIIAIIAVIVVLIAALIMVFKRD